MLEDEEHHELETKEICEHDSAQDTKQAQVSSRTADELTDEKSRLEKEIEGIVADIKDKESQIKAIDEELAESARMREDEAKSFEANKVDDEAAVGLVEKAHEVLASFYS